MNSTNDFPFGRYAGVNIVYKIKKEAWLSRREVLLKLSYEIEAKFDVGLDEVSNSLVDWAETGGLEE